MLLLQRDKFPTSMQAFDLLFLGTSDVGRGRNLLVDGCGAFSEF